MSALMRFSMPQRILVWSWCTGECLTCGHTSDILKYIDDLSGIDSILCNIWWCLQLTKLGNGHNPTTFSCGSGWPYVSRMFCIFGLTWLMYILGAWNLCFILMYGLLIIWIEFLLYLMWFAAPDSDLWKKLIEEVGCAY